MIAQQCLLLLLSIELAAASLTVDTNSLASGKLGIHVNGQSWLEQLDLGFNKGANDWQSVSNGKLVQAAITQSQTCSNTFGCGNVTTATWSDQGFAASVYHYPDTNAYVFEQHFITAVANATTGLDNNPATCFPAFKTDLSASLSYVTQHHIFGGLVNGSDLSAYPGDVQSGTPLILLNSTAVMQGAAGADDTVALVMSPLTGMKVAVHASNSSNMPKTFCAGLNGMVETIPADYKLQFVLTYGASMHAALEHWGDLLLKQGNKTRGGNDEDVTSRDLSGWTDNGAYYYYWMDTTHSYQETLADWFHYHVEAGIPVQSYQLDSWWYYKYLEFDGGLVKWEARPEVLPDGIEGFSQLTRKPITLHNRWFSSHNSYMHEFPFAIDGPAAMPIGGVDVTRRLFAHIMRFHDLWNLTCYEQDWLTNEYRMMSVAQSNVSIADHWLRGMGLAAADAGLTIQYCMPLPTDYLMSTQLPAVAQIRVSNDYASEPTNQWRVGKSSTIAWAVGLKPFKDVFRTTVHQPGNYYITDEKNPVLQAIVATLSTGPVGIGDKINMTNTTLLSYCMMRNGTLLQPSKPATSLEVSYTPAAPHGEVWTTYSASGDGRLLGHYVFAGGVTEDYVVQARMLTQMQAGNYRVAKFDWTWSPTSLVVNASTPLRLSANSPDFGNDIFGWDLYAMLPQLKNRWVLVGEVDKFVSLSRRRVLAVDDTSDDLKLTVGVADGETVTLAALNPAGDTVKATCALPGRRTVSFASGSCH